MWRLWTWLAAASSLAAAGEWNYDAKGPYGPHKWEGIGGVCQTGAQQSPIDFVNVTFADIPRIFFHHYVDDPWAVKVKSHGRIRMRKWCRRSQRNPLFPPFALQVLNNGHSLKATFQSGPGKIPSISGGGLPGNRFEFAQMHFHWGKRDDMGSEHVVNGSSYPLELHLVHFNTR